MYIVGLLLFAASSAACAVAPDVAWLIVGRAVQGLGAALVMPIAMALLGAAFAPVQRPKALGLFSLLSSVDASEGVGNVDLARV